MRNSGALALRHAREDLRRDRGVNAALVAMIALSAALMMSGALVMERLVGAIDVLFEQARPPHFLQMHVGDYDTAALERFASQHPEIESWLIEDMIGFDGAALVWSRPGTEEGGDLAASMIDNLFVAQNTEFDHLVDPAGAAPQPDPGQVYPPIASAASQGWQVGDVLSVMTASGPHDLEIAGFVRDAQMASSLSSATRFLVSAADLATLQQAGGGVPEIIVAYRLTDATLATDLERAYTSNPELPMDGQSVTYAMIRMIHTISDGLVAMALMLVAFMLVSIALLNIRFVIRGRLQQDVRQIGAMKAIGLPERTIAHIYLTTYLVLTGAGCALGGVLALAVVPLLTRGVGASYGSAPIGPASVGVALLALAVVALVVIGSCARVLRGLRRVPVVEALVHGRMRPAPPQRSPRAVAPARSRLAGVSAASVNRRLALIDLRADARQWILIPLVFFLAAVLMTLPAHLVSTLRSPTFVTYMGAPAVDLLIDLPRSDEPAELEQARTSVVTDLQADERVVGLQLFGEVLAQVNGASGWQTMRIEVGDYSGPTISYTEGGPPGQGQIALSVLNAREHQLRTGDTLEVSIDGHTSDAVVSGIYADVTSGGYTAKMHGDPTGASAYVVYADLAAGSDPIAFAAQYGERFPSADVFPMREYVQQTTASMTGALRSAAILAATLGVVVAALITATFLKLRLARERPVRGALRALGFSTAEILAQVRGKTLLCAGIGAVLGAVAAIVFGGPLVSVLMSVAGVGLSELALVPSTALAIALPMALVLGALGAAIVASARLRVEGAQAWLAA